MHRRLSHVFLAVALASLPSAAAIQQPVKVKGGLISGNASSDSSIAVFKGIPYAAPPVSDLRWRAPRPPAPWQGIRKTDQFSASCVQNIVTERKPWTFEFMTHGDISEDCLYLNIWTPAKSAGERRPVLFWMYGGGNVEGSAAVPVYDGEGLAKKGLVVVTINYRLGVFGFFTHPELTKESDTSGNYGILDQLAALQWVHENIAAFGGDPALVTIAGQSAGAGDAHILVASPFAKRLFARAIEESGSNIVSNLRTLAEQEQDGLRFAETKGLHSLAELRAASWKDLITPVPTAGGRPAIRFGPVVDGHLLPASPNEVFAQGKQNDVPELTGCNKDDLGGGVPHPDISVEAFEKNARQRYGDMSGAFLKLYPAGSYEQAGLSQNDSARDQMRTSMYLWALNRAKTAKTKAYTYYWDHTLPGPDADKYGAFHTSEVPYVFNSLAKSDRPFADADRRIAEIVSSYWANFAATGDPNGKGLPGWPSVGEKPGMTMELGDKTAPISVAGDKAKEEFFSEFLSKPRPAQRP
jgi:para-nitrobenzyl esterase